VTSGPSPSSTVESFSSPSVGAEDGATDRTPPALAWNVSRDEEAPVVGDADADGVGAGVGYE